LIQSRARVGVANERFDSALHTPRARTPALAPIVRVAEMPVRVTSV